MGKYIFEGFADYNERANAQMNAIIKTISEEEWDKPFSSYWKSIHELCAHIFTADYGWLNRFRVFANSQKLPEAYFCMNYNWGEKIFENINEYIMSREELDEKIIVFVDEITNEDLVKIMSWTDWEGNIIKKKLGIYIAHMFNHASHHRAQIAIYLDMIGKENDFSIFFDRTLN
jgi:uncharacterized damage-inducible protein DinB